MAGCVPELCRYRQISSLGYRPSLAPPPPPFLPLCRPLSRPLGRRQPPPLPFARPFGRGHARAAGGTRCRRCAPPPDERGRGRGERERERGSTTHHLMAERGGDVGWGGGGPGRERVCNPRHAGREHASVRTPRTKRDGKAAICNVV